ncbi:hypothetical protein CYMTET_37387 [Cymbomonas tetramitiformis]|uniref:Uncharacterized protein n=2 Tax=Cymbomonas tetramitiformis TaxID=36881 RepID=A0AAE0F6B3_9CHLO|nr:hypothetical protein CYMTET_37387 [Cymbomonas tetramitiformis]
MHTLRTYFARASDSPPPTDLANVRTVAREEAKYIADWTAAARELFVRAKEGAKNRDIDFALPSPDFLADLAEAQKGRCAITGLRMLPRQPAESEGLPSDECWRRFAPSVDRIRSDGHYTRDNVQLTCVFANVGKAEADDESFKRFLRGLAPDPTDEHSNVVETISLRPPKRRAPTRGDVVKRKREVALLQCDAKEKRIKLSMSKLERDAVESTRSLTIESVKKESREVLDIAVETTPSSESRDGWDQIKANLKPVAAFVHRFLNMPVPAFRACNPITSKNLHNLFFCCYGHLPTATFITSKAFGNEFNEILIGTKKKPRTVDGFPVMQVNIKVPGAGDTRGRRFGSLENCRKAFEDWAQSSCAEMWETPCDEHATQTDPAHKSDTSPDDMMCADREAGDVCDVAFSKNAPIGAEQGYLVRSFVNEKFDVMSRDAVHANFKAVDGTWDWEKIGDWNVPFAEIYKEYLRWTGTTVSKAKFGRILNAEIPLVSANRDGGTTACRLGLMKKDAAKF